MVSGDQLWSVVVIGGDWLSLVISGDQDGGVVSVEVSGDKWWSGVGSVTGGQW